MQKTVMELLSFNKHKGQFSTTEFLLMVFILMFLIVAATTIWNSVSNSIRQNIIKNELETVAIDISDKMVNSQGLPTDWETNTSKIFSLGLARENYILDVDKVVVFVNLSYSQIKSLFGISGYEFYFRLVNTSGYIIYLNGISKGAPVAYIARQHPSDTGIFHFLNKSNLVWDFYWESDDTLPAGLIPNTARYVYAKNDIPGVFKWVIANLSNYNTFIDEDTHIKWDKDLNSSEQQKLRDFINISGNTYFHVQHHEDFMELFGITPTGVSTDDGTVVNNDEALLDTPIGTRVIFQTETKTFDTSAPPHPLKVIINATNSANKCTFCKWTYGKGSLYYLPDMNTTTPGGYVPGMDIIGMKMEVGNKPTTSATNIINTRRIVTFNNEIVYLDVIVWK